MRCGVRKAGIQSNVWLSTPRLRSCSTRERSLRGLCPSASKG